MLSCPHKGLEGFQMLLGLTADGEAILLCDGCRFQLKVSIRSTATNYTVNPSFGQIFIVTSLGSRHSLCSCMYMYSYGPSFNQCIAAVHILWRWVNRHSEIRIMRAEAMFHFQSCVCVCVCVHSHMYIHVSADVRYLSQCLLILFVETDFFF